MFSGTRESHSQHFTYLSIFLSLSLSLHFSLYPSLSLSVSPFLPPSDSPYLSIFLYLPPYFSRFSDTPLQLRAAELICTQLDVCVSTKKEIGGVMAELVCVCVWLFVCVFVRVCVCVCV